MNKENLILGNYSAIPNYFIDNFVSTISASECVIMLCILRKTIGFQKLEDQISLSQLVKLSGFTKKTCINCLQSLEQKNFIYIDKSTKDEIKQTNIIKINLNKIIGNGVKFTPPWCNQSNFYGVKITHTKETKQNKREFFSFEKKEEYPEIPILNNEMLQNTQDFDFKEVNTLS
jgi:hypothetical protein